ncbi:hypothetical protein SteCoe_34025 [Stentor coeruleus]|uniref:Transmembrane protein 230 n=1 Tax=Stentor coeruleus TaxID=5963 RepID=A0A1R2AVM1_9CILI|nr:hypothetical protein SteCoe_34025 [Stentor coeruleus]
MNEENPRYNFEINDEICEGDIKIEYIGPQVFPKIPIKPMLAAIFLLICGIVLTLMGFIEEFTNFEEPSRGIAFWVLGSLTLTPGLYFSIQFYRAYRAKTPAERMTVLRNIPDIN